MNTQGRTVETRMTGISGEGNPAVRMGGWLLLCLLALGPVQVGYAAAPWVIEEDSQEIAATYLRLPTSAGGLLIILDCDGCRSGRYRLADDIHLELRGEPVSLDELRKALDSGRYGSVYLDVRRTTGEVSRLRIYP